MSDRAITHPSRATRLFGVWYRHVRVYTRNLISNGFPPFFEPLIFFAAMGMGLAVYVGEIDGVPYLQYLAAGIIIPPAMFTASFECTFGTFIRLEFDKIYEGMLSAPMSVNDLLIGELLFAATKGLFFSTAVLIVITAFGYVESPLALLAPLAGLLTGLMFASLSLFVTSFVKTINHFNFYFTGLLTPMFFFSGIFFPLSNLPQSMQLVSEFLPLTHVVRIARGCVMGELRLYFLLDLLYAVGFTALFCVLAVYRLRKRLID